MSYIYKGQNLPFLNKNLEIYLPPIVWIVFIGYMLFPSTRMFNYKGRVYFFEICRDIIISPFIYMGFLIPWATDQMLSLVIPLRDFSYTICYSMSSIETGHINNNCFSYPYDLIEKIIIFSPLAYRFLQCIKVALQKTGWDSFMSIVNAGKYMSSVIMTIFSFYLRDSNTMYWLWVAFLLISTFYSFAWDVRKDFGFMEPNSKNFLLRDKLYYPRKVFYYLAVLINFVLRFTWTLTLSPTALDNLIYKTMLTTVLGILETFRRSIWNYIRIELENLKYETDYSSVEGFELPFNIEIDAKDPKLKGFINKLIETEISTGRMASQDEFLISKNFNIEETEYYLNEFRAKQKVKLNPEKYDELNRSLNQDEVYECCLTQKKSFREMEGKLNALIKKTQFYEKDKSNLQATLLESEHKFVINTPDNSIHQSRSVFDLRNESF